MRKAAFAAIAFGAVVSAPAADGTPQSDDITALAIRRAGNPSM
jgi:hypothetical protein